jgi:hypothetical protein
MVNNSSGFVQHIGTLALGALQCNGAHRVAPNWH